MSLYPASKVADVRKFGERLASFADACPNKRFIVVVPSGDTAPAVSPLYELLGSPRMTAGDAANALRGAFSGHQNVVLVTDADFYGDSASYYDGYYRTDHHWNLRGAVRCFNDAASQMGVELFPESDCAPIEGEAIMGSNARDARWLTSEPLVDTQHDFSGISITFDDGATMRGDEHSLPDSDGLERRLALYGEYYAWGNHCATGPGNGNALVVGDSFLGTFFRLVEERYEFTRVAADAYWRNEDGTLDQRVRESQADDIFFVATAVDLANMNARIPHYFDIGIQGADE